MPILINNKKKICDFIFEVTGYKYAIPPPKFPESEYVNGIEIKPMKE